MLSKNILLHFKSILIKFIYIFVIIIFLLCLFFYTQVQAAQYTENYVYKIFDIKIAIDFELSFGDIVII